MNPTPDQLHRAAVKWQGTKDGWHEDRKDYFLRNWRDFPGLARFVEDEIAGSRREAISEMVAEAKRLNLP